MALQCPCCRANNDTGPNCRRCKADLGLLFDLHTHRQGLIQSAEEQILLGRYEVALERIREAETIFEDPRSCRLRATAHLLNRDFAAAWAGYSSRLTG